MSFGSTMWLLVFFIACVIIALVAGLRFPNAVGSWGIAVIMVAVPLLASVVSAPSRFGALADPSAYLPFINDLALLLVGLSAIIVLDCAAARHRDGGAAVFWIGLMAGLTSLSLAMHWSSAFRGGSGGAPTVADVSVLLSYVAGLLILSFVLRLATARD